MAALSVLFLGGTGIISSACSWAAVEQGIEVSVLTRGHASYRPLPPEVDALAADVNDPGSIREAIGERCFDAVVDWLAFTPREVQDRTDLFRGRTGQYVFISSASVYQTPPARSPITESTPLRNPFWEYSRNKIACEDLLVSLYRDEGYPVTVVRPSHTYDRTSVPFHGGWTVVDRMRRGEKIVVHGDGTSLWTLTHHRDFASDFVPLLGHPRTLGGPSTSPPTTCSRGTRSHRPWLPPRVWCPTSSTCRPMPSPPPMPDGEPGCWGTRPTR
jgi:nucleoside-diphosphate-sugar epimerase